MNPIYERAARVAARTPRFGAALFGGNALFAALVLFMLGLVFQRVGETGGLCYVEMFYISHMLVWAELILTVPLTPARMAGTVSDEREQRMLDLLFETALSPRRITLRNLLQNPVNAGVFALSGLPVLFMTLLFDGVSFVGVVLLFLGILFSVALLGSLGLFFSVANRATAIVIVEIYAAGALLFLVLFGTLLLTKSFGSAKTAISWLIPFSLISLMENLLFHATGPHDFVTLTKNPLLQQDLIPAALLEFPLMTLLLFAAVRVISPCHRKRKFIMEQSSMK